MQFLIVLPSHMEVRAAAAILCALPSSITSPSPGEAVFLETVLCPEVLALITATALLSRHHRTQREREIRTAGGGQHSPQTHIKEQGHPRSPLLASDN